MKTAISAAWQYSVLGNGPSYLIVRTRIAATTSVDDVIESLKSVGATILQHDHSSFECQLSARRLLGVLYRRKVRVSCRFQLDNDRKPFERTIVATCDLSNIRTVWKRRFYGLSLIVVAAAAGQFLSGQGSIGTWLALAIPWAIVEGNLAADRSRLRAKLAALLQATNERQSTVR